MIDDDASLVGRNFFLIGSINGNEFWTKFSNKTFWILKTLNAKAIIETFPRIFYVSGIYKVKK